MRTAQMLSLGAAAALAAVALAAPADGAPAVVAGWPVSAPAGKLLPTAGGGVAVISGTDVFAFAPTGFPLWHALRRARCGSCASGGLTPTLLANGQYGPFGRGGDIWAVNADGRFVPGCAGAVLADGTCVAALGGATATVRATAADGTTRWTYTEPDYTLLGGGSGVAPMALAGAGRVYVVLDPGTVTSTGAPVRYRVLAIDQTSGLLQWRTDIGILGSRRSAGPDGVPVAAGGGVVVAAAGALVGLDDAGGVRWTAAGGRVVSVGFGGLVLSDGRILDGATGERLGSAPPRFLARGPATSTIYSAVGDRGTRLVADDGGRGWHYDATAPIAGAIQLADGTVVVSIGHPSGSDGLLVRLDPARNEPGIRGGVVLGLSLRSFRTSTAALRAGARDSGTIIRVTSRVGRTLTTTLHDNGRLLRGSRKTTQIPPGTSFVRVLAAQRARPGRYTLTAAVSGPGGRTAAFPVTVRP